MTGRMSNLTKNKSALKANALNARHLYELVRLGITILTSHHHN